VFGGVTGVEQYGEPLCCNKSLQIQTLMVS
jgi:hypothetical protein